MLDDLMSSRLHYELIHDLKHTGICPSTAMLADRLGIPPAAVAEGLRTLADHHGVVLHPDGPRPWIVHPFSLTPTLTWIKRDHLSWWAPCIWCALGVAAIVDAPVTIHTKIGAEDEALTLPVQHGVPVLDQELVAHFAIPPRRAWDNVHAHCSLLLVFHSIADVHAWCARHSVPYGEAVPLPQVAELARRWYGGHASAEWHKWTVHEARQIFADVGLTSSFWTLEESTERF